VSDLSTSFTFRLTGEDKAALEHIAGRLGCDRGAALRLLIRRADPAFGRVGHFVTPDLRRYRVRLVSKGDEL
jgi:hypothetical protein